MPAEEKNDKKLEEEKKPEQQEGSEEQKGKPSAPSKPQRAPDDFEGFEAEVVEVTTDVRTGMYGEVKQAMCKVIDPKSNDRGRVIRRNLVGKIKKGDIVRLPDTSREARAIKAR